MYEEARDPIWQPRSPPPLVRDEEDDGDGGIEAEWAEQERARRVIADCVAWEQSYLERHSPDYDPYDY